MNIQHWQNQLGFTVISGKIRFDIWNDGRCSKIAECRFSPTGFRKTHWAIIYQNTPEEMAETTIKNWKYQPQQFSQIEE